jgi:CRP-like cAMP-binding protein
MNSALSSLEQLLVKSKHLNLKLGEPILYQGEVPHFAYLVKSGVVKAYDIGSTGDEKIVALAAPGEFIPPAWVFDKSPVSLYYYSAFTDCDLYIVQRAVVQQFIASDDAVARKMFDQYMGLYTGAVQQINALTQSKGIDKILYILQYLVMRFGHKIGNDSQIIRMRLTHKDVASMTGLTRETASVELNRLKKKGVISYKDQYYTVSSSKLQAMLGSEEFMNFKY